MSARIAGTPTNPTTPAETVVFILHLKELYDNIGDREKLLIKNNSTHQKNMKHSHMAGNNNCKDSGRYGNVEYGFR